MLIAASLLALLAAGFYFLSGSWSSPGGPQEVITTVQSRGVEITLSGTNGRIVSGENRLELAFGDASTGGRVEVRDVAFELYMPANGGDGSDAEQGGRHGAWMLRAGLEP